MAEDSEAVRRADALERRLRQLTAKVAKDGPTTAEDVHIAAVAWAVSDQREEAAAGTTTGADLQLLTTVRAHSGAGDATAQAICDAACRWRDHTRLDGPDEPGSFRWLLAQAVDRYRRPRWKKHRLRVGLVLGVIGGGSLIADGVMDFAGVESPLAHQVALAVAIVCVVASLLVFFLFSRSVKR